VLEDHKLVRDGPYRFVRHPIYTGMLGMIIAGGTGLESVDRTSNRARPLRYRHRDSRPQRGKLLREQFGAAFEIYKRGVPAVLPIKL